MLATVRAKTLDLEAARRMLARRHARRQQALALADNPSVTLSRFRGVDPWQLPDDDVASAVDVVVVALAEVTIWLGRAVEDLERSSWRLRLAESVNVAAGREAYELARSFSRGDLMLDYTGGRSVTVLRADLAEALVLLELCARELEQAVAALDGKKNERGGWMLPSAAAHEVGAALKTAGTLLAR